MDRKLEQSSVRSIEDVLGVGPTSRRSWARRKRGWLITLAILAVGGYLAFGRAPANKGPEFVSESMTRGDVIVNVTATGVVEPTNQVEISSELSGIIRRVFVDYNDTVKAGQVLLELDTVTLNAQVARTRASLAAARARVVQAKATVVEKEAQLKRTTSLAGQNYSSQTALEAAKAEFDRAVASTASADADVQVAEAELKQTETSLSKAQVYSPINGVVLKRTVEPGQTVAASFQTPILLTLAEDLRKMELRVDVDEADIGKVREGQSATFTVEAYQDKTFPARISQVRFASETVDGVVTYKAVLGFENTDLLLRPGMTATAEILIQKVEGAVLAPNAALRFKPPETPQRGGGLLSRLFFRIPKAPQNETEVKGGKRAVYVLDGVAPKRIAVTVGVTDGKNTQIVDGDLQPGQPVLTDVAEPKR
ncbi:MAG: efflux RND transporter periplasmic adaptor subunit [Hyphomicrobiales bacterium]|nr:efflux RND transporter periplasmic adaptor subunit [Hyphomicrobiales bacterium]